MSPDEFSFLAEFLSRRSGISLTSQKAPLITGRLTPVARRFGFRDVPSLIGELRYAREALASAVIEAMTINDSLFFRDKLVFDHLRAATVPALLASRSGGKRLRVWCSACAAGQEAYSLALLIDELKLVRKGWSIDLIATDLNSDLIARAEEGIFSEFEVHRGLNAAQLEKHFTRKGKNWRVNDSLRRMVTFRTFNLLDSFGWLYPLDLVLCRNVLIYFEQKARMQVIEKISEVLLPDGALVVGQNESLGGLSDSFARVEGPHGLYGMRSRGTVLRFRPRAATA